MITLEQNVIEKRTTSNLLKSVIAESKKIREGRGEDFFDNKKGITINDTNGEHASSKIQMRNNEKENQGKVDYRSLRDSHVKLNQIILDYDQKIFDKNNQVFNEKKKRSKSVHLYVDEKIESFLKAESKKSQTHWGLRKNAGLGNLIQKFLVNFIELKKREDRQLKRIRKGIEEFKIHLVEFKKYSKNGDDYLLAEAANQKLKTLSNDLNILLSVYEFESSDLEKILGIDSFKWLEFIRMMRGMHS